MAKNHKGEKESEDIRLALKMPARGSLQNRQVASAFKKVRQALRKSSGGGGRNGISSRTRGAAASGAASKGTASTNGGAAATAPKPLQRVSVRWNYAQNKGDGQWGAHGRYIERESAGRETELEISEVERELTDPSLHPEKELEHERDTTRDAGRSDGTGDRYNNPAALSDPGRIAALRESYAAEIGRPPSAKSFNNLRSLSSVGVVKWQGRGEVLLPGDAPDNLVERGTGRDTSLRRGSDGQSRKSGPAGGASRRVGVLGFGSGGDAMPISETLDRWQKAGDEHIFKLIVSPEFGDKMDLKKHVKELVAQMEKDLGTKLEWVAADHYNTDNPHVHLAVRGVDERGQVLEVAPQYIKEGSRIRAQEAATRQLGYRSEKDVAEALERQVTQQRFTDLDRSLLRSANEQGDPNIDFAILNAAKKNQSMGMDFSGKPPLNEKARDMRLKQIRRLAYLETLGLAHRIGEMKWRVSPELATAKPQGELLINLASGLPKSEKARANRLLQIRRLTQLTEMGLAEKVDNMTWRLNPSMESALRQMQVSQDRLKTKFQHREMITDPSAQLVTTELKELGQRVSGKLVGTGLNEQTNRAYMLIEGFDGKVHYVNQSAKVQKMRGEGELKAGDLVALEVVQRKDKEGKVLGEMVRVDNYGRTMKPESLDKELLKAGRPVERISTRRTVAGAFLDAAARRMEKLQHAGAVEVKDGRLQEKSRLAFDQVRFEDSGIKAVVADGKGPMLAKVLAKGRESIAVESVRGEQQILTAAQLAALGMEQKFVTKDATIFVGVDAKGDAMAAIIKLDRVPAMIQDLKPNRLDLMAQQLQGLPADHPLASAIHQRAETWKQRGVDVKSPEFGKEAAVWRKNMELAESSDLQNVIADRKVNRLDWMLQQAYQPTTAPLEEALRKRAEVWIERGVDPKDAKFTLKANVWRKSLELHEAAQQKGVEKVLEELSMDRSKPTRELQCEPGRQISGRVVLVNHQPDQTTVVVDTGRELTVIRQPAPSDDNLKAGQRIRAKAEEINDKNLQRRMMLWRFADLDREQARQKGKGKEGKFF